jgi:squalene cyclase
VCFTYGAFFSVKALVAAGRTYENSSSISKGCHFILSKQLRTGGWGESHVSNETKVNIGLFFLLSTSLYGFSLREKIRLLLAALLSN